MLLWTLEAALRIRSSLNSALHNQTGWKLEIQTEKSLSRFQFQGMENRLHQRRVSFSDSHPPKHHGSSGSINDKAWNWLPRETFHDECIRDDEYVTSVAAAAFAIHSLEEAELHNLQKMRESLKSSRRPSYGETSTKRSFGQDPRTQESAFPVRHPSGISPPTRPVSPALGHQKQHRIPLQHKHVKTRPETCEKAMIKMIQKQYEKMKSKIISPEFMKKIQAKAQRAMEMQSYQTKGARAGLEDKRRKESEARKKTNKNRKSSKVLVNCLCFKS